MENVPLYHTFPMMNMDLYEHREASTTLALAAQNKDINMLHLNSHFANTDPHICALGAIVGECSNFKKNPMHTQDHGDVYQRERRVSSTYPRRP